MCKLHKLHSGSSSSPHDSSHGLGYGGISESLSGGVFLCFCFYQGSAGGGWTKWMEPNWCIHSCSANSLCFSRQCTGEVQCICVWLARLVSSCREIRPSNLTSVIHFRARLLISCLFTPTWADLFQSGLSHCEELCLQGQFVTCVNIKSFSSSTQRFLLSVNFRWCIPLVFLLSRTNLANLFLPLHIYWLNL